MWLLRAHVSFLWRGEGEEREPLRTYDDGGVDNAGRGNDLLVEGDNDGANDVALVARGALGEEEITTALFGRVARAPEVAGRIGEGGR